MCSLILQKVYQIYYDTNDSHSEVWFKVTHVIAHDFNQVVKVLSTLIGWEIAWIGVLELGQEPVVLCIFWEHLNDLQND